LQKTLQRSHENKITSGFIGFLQRFTRREHHRVVSHAMFFPRLADEMMLLIFGAGLISLFRFARTVTILQQIVRQLSANEARRKRSAADRTN
jgi:hypothetical protein